MNLPNKNIYFTEKLFFLNLDNLEAAPGRPAPEFQVKTLKRVKFSYGMPFYSAKYIPNNISYY